jgi:hypothetical protein
MPNLSLPSFKPLLCLPLLVFGILLLCLPLGYVRLLLHVKGAIVAAHGGMSPESAWRQRQVEGEVRGRRGWEGGADRQGVGQGWRRNGEAGKRLMGGLRESGQLRRPNSQALSGSGRGRSGERNSSCRRRLRIARDGSPGQTEAGGNRLRRPNSQAFSSSGRGAMTHCVDAQPEAAAVEPASGLVRGS